MINQRRKSCVLMPECHPLETRLALSGNFLSHGYADVVRELTSFHHHHTEHASMQSENLLGHEMPVHYDHVNAHHVVG